MLYTVDPKGWYTNIEVYANSLVEHITKGGNSDAESLVEEYYPGHVQSGIDDIDGGIRSEVVRIEYYNSTECVLPSRTWREYTSSPLCRRACGD